jgi:hypothetical protein
VAAPHRLMRRRLGESWVYAVAMGYLLGDSTDSGLEFNFLDFTRDVVECAAVLVEAELELVTTIDKRAERERVRAEDIKAIKALGLRAAEAVAPTAMEQPNTPAGRCAGVIAAAVKDSVDREIATARAALASDLEELDRADKRVRTKNRDVLEKLLRAHDLPTVEKTYEVVWTASAVKATMQERATFGVAAVLALDIPASSLLAPDLRVDRVVDGVEVHAVEIGGWLKKADKVVPHKLGRYHITRVAVGADVTIRVQSTLESSALGFTITVRGNEPMLVERHGDGAKEFTIEDQDKAKLCQLAAKLEKEVRALDAHRGELMSVEVDGKPIAEHAHPRELAERLIRTIAPTVQNIARHSRSPGELVLRRLLGGNRREELFMATSELVKLYERLPEHGRAVFAPLELDGKPYVAPPETKPVATKPVDAKPADAKPADAKPVDAKPVETKPADTKPVETKPEAARASGDTLPPISSPARPRTPTAQRLTSDRSAPVTAPPPVATATAAADDEQWDEPNKPS